MAPEGTPDLRLLRTLHIAIASRSSRCGEVVEDAVQVSHVTDRRRRSGTGLPVHRRTPASTSRLPATGSGWRLSRQGFGRRQIGVVGIAVGEMSKGGAVPKTIAILGSALFFAVAPSTVAGLVPWWITRWEFRPPFFDLDATRAVGILLIVAGLPGLVDSFARFALQGLGTPAPIAPTQNLVVTGLYRYV